MGRPLKYKTPEEAKKAKALSDKARYAKKTHTHPDGTIMTGKKHTKNSKVLVEGDGIISDIGDLMKSGKRKIDNTIDRVSSVAKEVIYGATDLPRLVQEILKKYGNDEIASLTIMRTPVPKLITGALSFFSSGKFGEKMKENNFDTLFHLFLEATMVNGSRIQVEKNERINMIVDPPSRPKTETEPVMPIPSGLNLNTMMANTERFMGKSNFLGYSAERNNCQDFLSAILQANKLGDANDIAFIKQDTKSLFENLPYLRKFANTLTDIGAKASAITSGGGMGKYINMKIVNGQGFSENNIYDNTIMNDMRFKKLMGGKSNARIISGMGRHMGGMDRHMGGMGHCSVCGSGIFDDIGNTFKNVGSDIRGGVERTFTPKLGRDITSGLIHKALPGAISTIASSGTTALTGNPLLGLAVGQTLGKYAGKRAGDELGRATGYGLRKPNAWIEMVKKVQKDQGITYKEAMTIASQMRKKN